jgi:hypothetical protein
MPRIVLCAPAGARSRQGARSTPLGRVIQEREARYQYRCILIDQLRIKELQDQLASLLAALNALRGR